MATVTAPAWRGHLVGGKGSSPTDYLSYSARCRQHTSIPVPWYAYVGQCWHPNRHPNTTPRQSKLAGTQQVLSPQFCERPVVPRSWEKGLRLRCISCRDFAP